MLSDFQKFINSIIVERTSTPLFSTFFISWSLWNWQPIYSTIFVDEARLPDTVTKLDYVVKQFDWLTGLAFPLVSTGLLIFVVPYLANWTYKVSLNFQRKRIDLKTKIIDKDRLLTYEQAAEIRNESAERVQRAERASESIERERKILSGQVAELQAKRVEGDIEREKFKIVLALYGRDFAKYVDVTDILNVRIVSNGPLNFNVDNATFGVTGENNDPAHTHWKELLVTYQYARKTKTFKAIEGDKVTIYNGEAIVTPGFQSERIKVAIKAMQDAPETQKAWANFTKP